VTSMCSPGLMEFLISATTSDKTISYQCVDDALDSPWLQQELPRLDASLQLAAAAEQRQTAAMAAVQWAAGGVPVVFQQTCSTGVENGLSSKLFCGSPAAMSAAPSSILKAAQPQVGTGGGGQAAVEMDSLGSTHVPGTPSHASPTASLTEDTTPCRTISSWAGGTSSSSSDNDSSSVPGGSAPCDAGADNAISDIASETALSALAMVVADPPHAALSVTPTSSSCQAAVVPRRAGGCLSLPSKAFQDWISSEGGLSSHKTWCCNTRHQQASAGSAAAAGAFKALKKSWRSCCRALKGALHLHQRR
jgi:hypothetical protein